MWPPSCADREAQACARRSLALVMRAILAAVEKVRWCGMLQPMPTNEELTPPVPNDEPIAMQDDAAESARVLEESVVAQVADALSPAVRRLVRQYDLDITGIHGTGPEGR